MHDLRVKVAAGKLGALGKRSPSWFDDEFIESIPHEWVPAHARPKTQRNTDENDEYFKTSDRFVDDERQEENS